MQFNTLTFTRFLAAMMVVIYHMGVNAYPFTEPVFNQIAHNGGTFVTYFYCLSGFIMTVVYINAPKNFALNYYKNRFARIYPLYFLTVIFTYIVFTSDRIKEIPNLIYNLLAIQTWLPGRQLSLNGVGWSVSAEIFFYLLFPVLLLFLQKNKRIFTSVLVGLFLTIQIGVFIYTQSSTYNFSQKFLYYNPLFQLSGFLAGIYTAIVFLKNPSKKNYDLWILACIAMWIVIIYFGQYIYIKNGLLSLIFCPLIYFIAKNKSVLNNFFSSRFFVFLGDISFGIYILQTIVFKIYFTVLYHLGISSDEQAAHSGYFYFYCFLLILVSALVYYLIEKPARKKLRSAFKS